MKSYTIGELASAAGVTPRTIRFYTAEGLLPPPESRDRYAQYSQDHLNRLNVIQELKRSFLPLHAIRDLLEQKSPEELAGILDTVASHRSSETAPGAEEASEAQFRVHAAAGAESTRKTHDPESAVEYIRRIAESASDIMRESAPPRPPAAPAFRAFFSRSPQHRPATSEQWERISLTPEIEIHARTPRSPEAQRLIDRLLAIARRHPNP